MIPYRLTRSRPWVHWAGRVALWGCGLLLVAPLSTGEEPVAAPTVELSPAAPAPSDVLHWAFVGVSRPPLPDIAVQGWTRRPLDRFIQARLEAVGARPSPMADRRTLARRITLDLTGLPPEPERVEGFARDPRPDAYESLVDELLASPHYGERWAQPWLDLAHYADSDGYLTDQLRPYAWRYRAWLVDALNRDLTFERWTLEQLAGDLVDGDLADEDLPADDALERRLATGFLRNTLSNREGGADLEEFRVAQVADRTSTIGTAWLGLTLGCARCHDHKYDPISQREYFQLFALLNQVDEVNVDAPRGGELADFLAGESEREQRRRALLEPLETELLALQSEWESGLLHAAEHPGKSYARDRSWEILGLVWGGGRGEGQLEGQRIVRRPATARSAGEKRRLLLYFLRHGARVLPEPFKRLELGSLSKKLESIDAAAPVVSRAPVVEEAPTWRTTYVHVRGNFREIGSRVEPAAPRVLPPLEVPEGERASRRHLASWLTSGRHPLVARVAVNRMWQAFFGRGLVRTPEDFGTRGSVPSHPQLLDWLAAEFVDSGWQVKALQREIVLSATYRQSSTARPDLEATDPENVLLARQNRLRLPAETIRDSSLFVSGLLERRIGGPSVRPPQPASVSGEGYEVRWEESTGADRYRRGLYTFIQRTTPYAQFLTFDAPDPNHACARRERSNTPLQALALLNDEVFVEAATVLGTRLADGVFDLGATDIDAKVTRACRGVLARSPLERERARLVRYFHEQLQLFEAEDAANPPDDAAPGQVGIGPGRDTRAVVRAWIGVVSVLLNLDEFIHRE
jgi:hypothetical protein